MSRSSTRLTSLYLGIACNIQRITRVSQQIFCNNQFSIMRDLVYNTGNIVNTRESSNSRALQENPLRQSRLSFSRRKQIEISRRGIYERDYVSKFAAIIPSHIPRRITVLISLTSIYAEQYSEKWVYIYAAFLKRRYTITTAANIGIGSRVYIPNELVSTAASIYGVEDRKRE